MNFKKLKFEKSKMYEDGYDAWVKIGFTSLYYHIYCNNGKYGVDFGDGKCIVFPEYSEEEAFEIAQEHFEEVCEEIIKGIYE